MVEGAVCGTSMTSITDASVDFSSCQGRPFTSYRPSISTQLKQLVKLGVLSHLKHVRLHLVTE